MEPNSVEKFVIIVFLAALLSFSVVILKNTVFQERGNSVKDYNCTIEVRLVEGKMTPTQKYAVVYYDGKTYEIPGERNYNLAENHPGEKVKYDVKIHINEDGESKIKWYGISGGEIDYSTETKEEEK